MNTVKFSPKTELAKELHNLEHIHTKTCRIDNSELLLAVPVNVHVLVEDSNDLIPPLSEAAYRKNFLKSLAQLDPANAELSIRNFTKCSSIPRLLFLLAECHNRGYHFRTFDLSAKMLLQYHDNLPLCYYFAKYGCVNNVNLREPDEVSYTQLKKLTLYCHTHEIELRLSMDGSAVSSDVFSWMEHCMEHYGSLGFTSYIFRNVIIPDQTGMSYLRTLEDSYYQVRVYSYKDTIVKCYQEKMKQSDSVCTKEPPVTTSLVLQNGSYQSIM